LLQCWSHATHTIQGNIFIIFAMAENFASKQAEAVLGHGDKDRATHTDISNPDREGGRYADEGGEKMKALAWMGKNDVRVGSYC
jgi:hypothetical protein